MVCLAFVEYIVYVVYIFSCHVDVVRIYITFYGYKCNSLFPLVRIDGHSGVAVVDTYLKFMGLF